MGGKKDIIKKNLVLRQLKQKTVLMKEAKHGGGLPSGNQFSYGEKQVNTTNKY